MNTSILSTVSASALALLLTACGGQPDVGAAPLRSALANPLQAAGSARPGITVSVEPGPVPAATQMVPGAAANMPQPDCAAEGCNRLRIIDGNAEAWRIDAARRDALAAGL